MIADMFKKFTDTFQAKDVETYLSCFHENHETRLHSNGRKITMLNFDFDRTVKYMTEYQQFHQTCIYENDDILIYRFYNPAPDGGREAILWSSQKKMNWFGKLKID